MIDPVMAESSSVVAAAPPMASGEEIVYTPRAGDPETVSWRGHVFLANKPTTVRDQSLIAAARNNPFYRVGNSAPAVNRNDPPKTALEYRGYVVAWLKTVNSVQDLVTRWSNDRNLQHDCEVGSDDINYLGTLIDPEMRQLARQEGLTDQQVAGVWISHGILVLPWRS